VWCANASDGIITATPYWNRGKQLRDLEGKRALEKTALYTKVGDQICSVGYYKE
jgi:hypothetical protein